MCSASLRVRDGAPRTTVSVSTMGVSGGGEVSTDARHPISPIRPTTESSTMVGWTVGSMVRCYTCAVDQTKTEIQALLESIGGTPRHRFGQNFMIDQNLVRLVADSAGLTRDDVAIEVGPGTGTLTEELLGRAGRVIAVEIDRDLAALLRQRFADRASFSLIEGDALAGKHALNPDLLAEVRTA